MNIKIEKGFIYFKTNEVTAKKLDAHYLEGRKAWRLPYTLGALRELYKEGFDVTELGERKKQKQEQLLALKEIRPTEEWQNNLRPYQNVDINFLRHVPHAGIFNQMRTGKTPTTLKLIELEGHEKVIVVCPASLVLNWEQEVRRWTNYDNIFTISGSKQKRMKTYDKWIGSKGFLIVSKDTVKQDLDLLSSFKGYALIVDEAHFLRNYKSNQSKAVYVLGKHSIRRLTLTGTPTLNKPDDIYGILKFLYPEQFPSYWQFVERYFKTWVTPWGGQEVYYSKINPDACYKRKQELQELLDCISVQRKRAEVMAWIPKKTRQVVELEMSSKQFKAYESMLNTFTVEENGNIKVDAPSVLAQLTRLRQICLSPNLLNINAPSAKESFILEWLEDNPNEQVIIFSNFSSYLKELKKLLDSKKYDTGIITGETTKSMREKYKEWFQSGKVKILLANIEAAGVGLTLDAGSVAIFLDRSYVPALNEQAEDRIVPTTENSNQQTHIIDLVCKDSIDQKIQSMLEHKVNITKSINNYRNIKEFLEDN